MNNNQRSVTVGDININTQPSQNSEQIANDVMDKISKVYQRGG